MYKNLQVGLSLATAFLPSVALAQTFGQVVRLFNTFVGLMLVAAILTYCVGFVIWIVRLGTWPTYRTEGIKIMEWSVVILFVLVVILMVVQFFRDHPYAATYTVSAIILALIIWAVIVIMQQPEKKEEE